MRFSPRNTDARQGFTLLELMIVLVLIGIMAVMIIPEMKGTYDDALLRSTSRRLIDLFSLTSSRAVSANQLHRVRFDPPNNRYIVETRLRQGEQAGAFVPARDIPGAEGELDKRIAIEIRPALEATEPLPDVAPPEDSGQLRSDEIAFYPDGTADAIDVILRDREGFRLALRVNAITGRVNVAVLGRE